jgi:hypothetical protein
MNRTVYPEPRTFSRYDDTHALVYLNEEVIEDYLPEDAPEGTKPSTGYAYTGAMVDGGTLIDTADYSRDNLINGIIRTRYSQTQEDAIKTHQLLVLINPKHARAAEYRAEFDAFEAYREYAIEVVDGWMQKGEVER